MDTLLNDMPTWFPWFVLFAVSMLGLGFVYSIWRRKRGERI